jgi:DNA polymerase-3 subunit beta
MEFTVKKGLLQKALGVAGRIADSKVPAQGVDKFKLSLDDKLKIMSNDSTIFSVSTVPIESVVLSGHVLVHAKLMVSLINSLPVDENAVITIQLDQETGKLSIISDRAVHHLNTFAVEDYADFPQIDETADSIVISGFQFSDMISHVIPCVSKNTSKPQYSGVYVEAAEDRIIMAATDSSRFAYRFLPADTNGISTGLSVVAPLKFMDEMRKLVDRDEDIRFIMNDRTIGCVTSDTVMISRLINVEFPYFKEIIPTDFETNFSSIDSKSFRDIVKSVMPIAGENNYICNLEVDQGVLIIQSESDQTGNSKSEIKFEQNCPDMEIMFNINYINDALNLIETENIQLRLNSSVEPAIFKMDGRDDFFYILMPMRR